MHVVTRNIVYNSMLNPNIYINYTLNIKTKFIYTHSWYTGRYIESATCIRYFSCIFVYCNEGVCINCIGTCMRTLNLNGFMHCISSAHMFTLSIIHFSFLNTYIILYTRMLSKFQIDHLMEDYYKSSDNVKTYSK